MPTLKNDESVDKTNHAINPTNVKVGDIMALIQFVKVDNIPVTGSTISVKKLDKAGTDFEVRGKDLIATMLSADQVIEEIKISKTRAAEILITAFNQPFTVCFLKDSGEERILRGRLVRPEPLLGRSKCEDLDLPLDDKNNRLRLVDHRTIKYLILGGTKFVVK